MPSKKSGFIYTAMQIHSFFQTLDVFVSHVCQLTSRSQAAVVNAEEV